MIAMLVVAAVALLVLLLVEAMALCVLASRLEEREQVDVGPWLAARRDDAGNGDAA